MNTPFILFMLGICAFIAVIVIWDYGSLGRKRIDAAAAKLFADAAWARWKIGGETMALAQRTERAARLGRVKQIVKRNIRIIVFCDAGVCVLFTLFALWSFTQGRLDSKDSMGAVMGAVYFCALITALLAVVTGLVIVDTLGFRILLTFAGIVDTTPRDIAIAREGILYLPGGLQRFNYPIRGAEVIRGEISVLAIRTATITGNPRNDRAQEFYVPIPKGLETEAQTLATRLMS